MRWNRNNRNEHKEKQKGVKYIKQFTSNRDSIRYV